MASRQPLVSVLIVNFNGIRHLQECLESLQAQSYLQIEVVLVDNGSSDGSVEFVSERFPWVKLVRSPSNRGFAGGNNFGAPHCAGEYIYFLNNDTRADPDAIAALMRVREKHPQYEVLGSLLLNYADPSKVDSAGDTFYWSGPVFSFTDYPASLFSRPHPVLSAKGAAALYPRALLDRLGWFDEDYFLNFEDYDLALRSRHLGAQVLCVPESRVLHKGFGTLGGSTSKLTCFYGERNFPLVVIKNFPLPDLVRFLPGLLYVKAIQAKAAVGHGLLWTYIRGNLSSVLMIPRILARRRQVFRASKLMPGTFRSLLRKNLGQERLAFQGHVYDIPIQIG